MNIGDRVTILEGSGAGHEGVVVDFLIGKRAKVRTNDFGSCVEGFRVVTKPIKGLRLVRPPETNLFQGREFRAWVPPKVCIRDGALDFKAAPSIFAGESK